MIKPATVKEEIDSFIRVIQCPYCNNQGPFTAQHDVTHGWYIIACKICNTSIFKFEDV